jgi:hypothetical protein
VLVWPRPVAALLAADCTTATLGALVMSLTVGLFGFRESLSASFVTRSLAIEAITVMGPAGLGHPGGAPPAVVSPAHASLGAHQMTQSRSAGGWGHPPRRPENSW